ncbi:MAG: chorismate-binding protein [Desulfobacterales bacterium]|nr:chorismate-binding protein [Desulfobacterales bacterium]
MEQICENLRNLGIHVEPLQIDFSFFEIAEKFASLDGTVVLKSGTSLDCARYDILAVMPWLTYSARHRNIHLNIDGHIYSDSAHPFDVLKLLLKQLALQEHHWPLPVVSGLFGYFAYDLKDVLEELPQTVMDDLCLPHLYLVSPSIILIYDHQLQSYNLCIPIRSMDESAYIEQVRHAFFSRIFEITPASTEFSADIRNFKSNFSKIQYMDAVQHIKNYIAAGDVYQVNLSQRFIMPFDGHAFSLFKTLFERNPAPFFAFIQCGDHQIVSTSPERFIHLDQNIVETRPIKGTRKRGQDNKTDEALRDSLLHSPKDDAELSMIVDLLRNDIGKVCQPNTVKVVEHKRLEAYDNVFHLISIVQGILQSDKDEVDLLAAVFPGGSITGCPKIRAMEIIDELETATRHLYTGAIGYISFHKHMDLSIAIRTAVIHKGNLVISFGGGIVYDSLPEDEYEETLHKGSTFLNIFHQHTTNTVQKKIMIWHDGRIQPVEETRISPLDLGFQYGYGCFETIRYAHGNSLRLPQHIERFYHTWQLLFKTEPPTMTWHSIINQILRANELDQQTASVKLLAYQGNDQELMNVHLMVIAKPYIHRMQHKPKNQGMHLGIYRHQRHIFLAEHKTLNYLYYYLAGDWAKKNGFDEAIILNSDGTISETNTANILLIFEKQVIRPESPHVLPGVMLMTVCNLLTEWGYRIIQKPVHIEELWKADEILLSNALIGTVPVTAIDGKSIKTPSGLWESINKIVL